MIRVILQIVIPLVLPTALYLAYATFLRRKDPDAEIDIPKPVRLAPSLGAGCDLARRDRRDNRRQTGGRYVAPRQVDGKIVPAILSAIRNLETQGPMTPERTTTTLTMPKTTIAVYVHNQNA